jgi:hypothetical protein
MICGPMVLRQTCAALLSDEERARVAKFKFERNRLESLATRALGKDCVVSIARCAAAGLAIQIECTGEAGD